MRVAISIHQFPPDHITGTEQYTLRLAKELTQRGHEVFVFTGDPCLEEVPEFRLRNDVVDGVQVRRVRISSQLRGDRVREEYDDPWMASLFAAFLDEHQVDVVHFCHLQGLGIGLVDEAVRREIPTVMHFFDFWCMCPTAILLDEHKALCRGPEDIDACTRCMRQRPEQGYSAIDSEGVIRQHEARLDRPALRSDASARAERIRLAVSHVSRWIAPSRFLADRFAMQGYERARFSHVPYPVDGSLSGPASEAVSRPRAGDLRVGFVGNLARHKGVDLLVEAFRKLSAPAATLTLHGDPGTDRAFSSVLEAHATADGRIRLAGPFGPSERQGVFDGLDLLVVPSTWHENTPFVVLESIAARVPLIVSDVAGITEIAGEGTGALVFARGDQQALLGCLQDVVKDPSLLDRLRGQLQEPVRWPEHIEQLEALYASPPGVAPQEASDRESRLRERLEGVTALLEDSHANVVQLVRTRFKNRVRRMLGLRK